MRRTRAGGDARLHDRWSIGVGGHLNPGDADLFGGLRREWREELVADFEPAFEPLALLNDDTTDVGAVHLGIVFVADAAGRPVAVRETDKLEGRFAEPPRSPRSPTTSSRGAASCSRRSMPGVGPRARDRPIRRRPWSGGAAGSVVVLRVGPSTRARRLLDAPRSGRTRRELAPALDALGGEVVRLRSVTGSASRRAGCRPDAGTAAAGGATADPHEAILLLHGYSGSIAPDLVEYGPFLRRTAGVLGLDFRGHGRSDDGPSTFGLLEVEDVAGALAWLGERGITRVALLGTSMGGITAIAAVAVLGDGSLAAADADPTQPTRPAPRPRIVAVVGDSVAPELEVPIANRLRGPPAVHGRPPVRRGGHPRRRSAGDRAGPGHRPGRAGAAAAHPRRGRHDRADRRGSTARGAGRPARRALDRARRRPQRRARVAAEDYERRVTDFLRVAFEPARRGCRGVALGAPYDQRRGPQPVIPTDESPPRPED